MSAGLVVAVDASGSMVDSGKWDALRDGLISFVQDPASSDLGLALLFHSGATASPSCLAADYAVPTVPFGIVSDIGATAVTALTSLTPIGNSPLVPALQGAIDAARTIASSTPSEIVVIFTADTEATSCDLTVTALAAAAAQGLAGTPSIRTHVLHFTPSEDFTSVATAGGTTPWPMVSTSVPAAAAVLDVLTQIRRMERDCRFSVPPEVVAQTQMVFARDAAGTPTPLLPVSDATACGAAGGFVAVQGRSGTQILLCPASCDIVLAGGSTEFSVPCR